MSTPDLTALVTPSKINDLLDGVLRHRAMGVQIPTAEDPQTVINAEISEEDLLGIAQEVGATIDQGQFLPNGLGVHLNLWITSPNEINEDAWFGDLGLVGIYAWVGK